jgi:Asp-tRNA(Asn)/Glu-tRNA(Gln) amidotransferase A subunit family amidase
VALIYGIPEGPYLERADEEARNQFKQACDLLGEAGVQLKYIKMFENFEEIIEYGDKLCEAEFAIVHHDWFPKYSDLYSEGNRQAILRGQKVDSDTLEKCRAHRETLRNELLDIMVQHNLAAFLAPAAPGPAPKGIDTVGDWVMSQPWSHTGLPVVTVPSGVSKEGLPLGLQLIGGWMDDERLLNLAKHLAELQDSQLCL